MPLINVKVIEGAFDASEKKQIVHKLTDAMCAIEGEALRSKTLVTVEVKGGDWGFGGQALSGADVRALRSGRTRA